MSQKYLDDCAMMAMQAIMMSGDDNIEDIGRASYIVANEMLKVRSEYGKSTKTTTGNKKRLQGQKEVGDDRWVTMLPLSSPEPETED